MTGLLKPCACCGSSPRPFVAVIRLEFFLRKLWIHFWLGGHPAKSLTKADSFARDNRSAMSPHHLHQSMRAAFCLLLSSCWFSSMTDVGLRPLMRLAMVVVG